MRVRFEQNASPDIGRAAEEGYIVVVPLCCIEQHGPHLPVNCDYGRPIEAAERAARTHGAKVLVLPALPFGPAAEHVGFPGTISLSFETWSKVVVEVLENLVRDGFRRIVVTTGCGGHMGIEGPVYQFYCHTKRRLPELDVRVFGDQVGHEIGRLAAEAGLGDTGEVHAGGVETSMALARNPELVHLDRLRKPERQGTFWHGCWWIAEQLTETGATGDPTKYDVELGRRIGERVTRLLADFLGEMWRYAQGPGTSPPGDRSEEAGA
jgi:creatinine amidohydrolase